MNRKLQEYLFTRFPKIFPEELRVATKREKVRNGLPIYPIHHGISVMDGWFDLLVDLFIKIQDMVDNEETGQIVVYQVKEKFGKLRLYFIEEGKQTKPNKRIETLIAAAENKSGKICEVCGKFGKIEDTGHWLVCLCKKDLERWKEGWRPWREEKENV